DRPARTEVRRTFRRAPRPRRRFPVRRATAGPFAVAPNWKPRIPRPRRAPELAIVGSWRIAYSWTRDLVVCERFRDSMPDTLSEDERTVVTARAEQFRHALVKGGVTDWEPFLTGLEGVARSSLLVGLIVLDLGYRWGKSERPSVEDYVARFPEL